MMKITVSLLLVSAVFLLSCSAASDPSSHSEEEGNASYSADGNKTITKEVSVRFYEDMEECISQADIILTGTVSDIGETYLYGDPVLPDGIHETSWPAIARDFRTPVTLEVSEVLLDNTGTVQDTLTVTEYRGTYDGYTVLSPFPVYEENQTYLLFVAVAPDGETNIVMHQGSAVLSSGGEEAVTPLFNEKIFAGIFSVDDMKTAISKVS